MTAPVTAKPRVLVIQHEDDCPPAWFGEWFEAASIELDVRLGHRGDEVPRTIDEHDALVVLGGEMGAHDDATHPWLTATKALIADVVAVGRPFLGICLGHQLAAVALGGEVIVNPAGQAVGLALVRVDDEGTGDDLLSSVDDGASSIQWNNDIVSRLPEGSVRLATAPDGTVQAARFAPLAWGVQFHPEASPDVFASWLRVVPPGEDRDRLTETSAQIAAAESDLRRAWEPLARRFAAVVSAHVAVP
jgi:GMP synthase (glutamine-hydrolysing)